MSATVESLVMGNMFAIVDSGFVVRGIGIRHAGDLAEIGHPIHPIGSLDMRPGDWLPRELDQLVAQRGWQVVATYCGSSQ